MIRRFLLLLAVLLFTMGCDMASPTAPSGVDPAVPTAVERCYFDLGAADLVDRGIAQNVVNSVPADRFTFTTHDGPFDCKDGAATAGCFRPERMVIDYQLGHEYTMRHEAKHALLFAAGDSRWRCVDHSCLGTPIHSGSEKCEALK